MGVRTITTQLSQPTSKLLTSLYAVHLELNIASGDTSLDPWFNAEIPKQSRAIEHYCNRDFWSATWADNIMPYEDPYPYQVPGWLTALQLSRWPVLAVPPVTIVQNLGNGMTQTLTEDADFLTDRQTGTLTRLCQQTKLPTYWEDYPSLCTYVGGYAELAEPATVPDTPYQISTEQPNGSWQSDLGVTYASGAALVKVASAPTVGQYSIVPATAAQAPGSYQFAEADQDADVLISYTYIPLDLEDAALRLITGRKAARGRDPLLKAQEQALAGRQEYWIGAPPMLGNLPAEVARLIDHYRVPVVG